MEDKHRTKSDGSASDFKWENNENNFSIGKFSSKILIFLTIICIVVLIYFSVTNTLKFNKIEENYDNISLRVDSLKNVTQSQKKLIDSLQLITKKQEKDIKNQKTKIIELEYMIRK